MNEKYRPIKLEDLAKKLNVSNVTVSKALRDHPDISSETKQRVKELAEKMGYVPNLMARNLSSRKSMTIGLVVPKIAHIFFSSIIEAVYDAAFEKGYEIVLTISGEHEEREKKHVQTLLSMKVDGLIISITQETKDLTAFERVVKLGLPLIFIDRVPDVQGASSISVDDFGGAYAATEYAVKKGYKRIAHIGGYQYINIGKHRYDGFKSALEKYGMHPEENLVTFGGFSEEDGYNAFTKMAESGQLPEYILAVTYPVALGIFSAASERGIQIPGDIEVTCFGKNTFNKYIPSIFNFIDQPAVEIGTEAVKLMIEQLQAGDGFSPRNIQLGTELMLNDKMSSKLL